LEVFARQGFLGRVEAIDFLPQFSECRRVAEKVKEDGREDRFRGIGPSNDNKVTIVEDDVEWYFLFLCAGFVGLWGAP
jgi:hypothetical protein